MLMARLTVILGALAMVVYLLGGVRFVVNEWRNWRNKGTWLTVLALCLLPTSVWAEDLYVGQSDAGAANGTSCANQHSAVWFNTAGNWGGGAGEIDPGDTAHVCGTITSTLTVQASGSAGLPTTLRFETDAKLSQAVCSGSTGCLNLNNRSYITVDGGANGIVESTDNGTSPTYGNQLASIGVSAFPCSNCEIKNLTIQNLYVHTVDLTDSVVTYSQVNAVKLAGSNTTVHDNTMHDGGWCIYQLYSNGNTSVSIHHNEFYHCSKAWVPAGSGAIAASNFQFYNNHYYNSDNWDTTADTYHGAGIHAFGVTGAVGDAYDIYNNVFEGSCGTHMTAQIYMEGNAASAWTATGTVRIFNNVITCESIVNGLLQVNIGHGDVYNNTVIGTVPASGSCVLFAKGINMVFRNNAISGCSTLLSIDSVTTVATPSADLNYNTYANCTTANCWNWTGVQAFTNNLTTWRTGCGCDGNSTLNSSLLVDAAGRPGRLSLVVDAGTDLSGVGITALNSDRLGVARPQLVTWDTGAYEYQEAASSPAVLGRVIRWMELLLPVAGLGWHYRRAVLAGVLAVCSISVAAARQLPVATTTVKALTYQTTLTVLTTVNAWTKPKDL